MTSQGEVFFLFGKATGSSKRSSLTTLGRSLRLKTTYSTHRLPSNGLLHEDCDTEKRSLGLLSRLVCLYDDFFGAFENLLYRTRPFEFQLLDLVSKENIASETLLRDSFHG